jgi:hypothetical protein
VPANRLRVIRTAVLLWAVALLAAACVDFGLPPDCDGPDVAREVTVTSDAMTPGSIEICRDQQVTLVVDAETDGVFHIHGYDEQVPATTIEAGVEESLRFVAGRSGQFPIELHPAGDPTGIDIGILTVHEP